MLMPSPAVATSTAQSLIPSFVSVCSRLAPAMSVLVCLAPMPTIQQIKKSSEGVGSLPLLPYSCMTANCGLWTTYGLLKHETAIWAPNLVGVLLAIYYCYEFIKLAPKGASPTLPGSAKQHVRSLIAVAVATLAAVLGSVRPDYIGQAAVLLCIALFASPLSSLKTVIQTKSARSIPLPFTLASVVACFSWSVTGIMHLHDLNVIIPNVLGFLFGMAQVTLKLIYGGGGSNAEEPKDAASYFLMDEKSAILSEEEPGAGYSLATP